MSEEIQSESDAMASLLAGYNNDAHAEEAPAEEVEVEDAVVEEVVEESTEVVPSLAEELATLKARVASMHGDPDEVRKLHGEIGNINRTLKTLQKPEAPVDDELTAALKAAEEAAEEFPEVAGPMLRAIRALSAAKSNANSEPVDIKSSVATEVAALRAKEVEDAVHEAHPDFKEVITSNGFHSWVKGKTPELQEKILGTNNPAVAANYLSEYKTSLQVKQKKQDRLAAAVVTPSGSQRTKPSTLNDDEGLLAGYNSGPKRQIFNR